MRTFFFIPPVRRAVGGVAVLLRMAQTLAASGRPALLAEREAGDWRPADLAPDAPVRPWNGLDLTPDDLWVAPEGWPNSLAPALKARSRCLIYCQNWAYLFSSLPPGVDWNALPANFLAVSEPVARFVEASLGRAAPVLRPGIDRTLFRPPAAKPGGPVRIAYMPRKNKAAASQILDAFQARSRRLSLPPAVFVPIEGLDAAGVAETLRQSHVFLVTGFPEGCPLPPLEAMACGAVPVGFTGYGGLDYMRQVPGAAFVPAHPLRPVPWSGNGLWSADNDVPDAVQNLELAVRLIHENGPALSEILAAGQATATAYGLDRFRENLLDLWDDLAANR